MSETPDMNVLLDLIQRQSAASRALTDCTTFREMAGAIAQHMLFDAGQFITVNLLEYGSSIRLTAIATANRHNHYDAYDSLEVNSDEMEASLNSLLVDQKPLLVERLDQQSEISVTLRDWLGTYKIRSFAAWPMRQADRTFGLVCLNSLSETLPLSPAALELFHVLADQVAALVQVNHLSTESSYSHEISERQRQVFDELNPSLNVEQMANVVARHMLTAHKRFVTVLEFFQDEQGHIAGWHHMVTANREQTYNWGDARVNLDWEMIDPALQDALGNQKPIIIEDIDALPSSFGGQALIDSFQINKIKAMIMIPVVVIENKMLVGLGIMSLVKTTYTKEEINALSNVAEQVGVLIQARTLLQETQSAQELAAQLAKTNHEIAAAENYEYLAKTLIEVMPESVKSLAIALFDRPIQTGERPSTLESKIIMSRSGVSHLQVVDQIPLHPDVPNILNRLLSGEIITLPRTSSPLLPPITVSLLQAQGVAAITLIALRIGPRLLGLFMLGSENQLTIGQLQEDNFRTLADQVAISIENRGLLDQTADTLSFVQAQFEATSAIYDSKEAVEILKAIYRFIGDRYQDANLGLVSDPATIRISAEIRDKQITGSEYNVPLNSYPAWEALPALETLYVPDVSNDNFLNEPERTALQHQNIDGLVIVPMVVNQRLMGLISFTNPSTTTLSPNQLRALRNLADQAAVVFENRALLASTAATLDETRLLYEVNRSILAAQDTLDVLRAIRQHLASDASAINHMTVVYGADGQVLDAKIDFSNHLDGNEQVFEVSMNAVAGPEGVAGLRRYWEQVPGNVAYLEDMTAVQADSQVAGFLLKFGFLCAVSIFIHDNNRVEEIINVTFDRPRSFDDHQRRLYEAVSDQVAIVLQNHQLLREAQISALQLARQVHNLQTINQFGTTINAASDETSLLNTSAQLVVELLGIDHADIVLVQPGQDSGIVVSEYPAHGSLGSQVATVNNPAWGERRSTSEFKPLLIANTNEDNRIEPQTRDILNHLGASSTALLPLVIHNQLVGSMALHVYAKGRAITPDMIEVGQIITAQVNLALENLRLLKDVQASAERLKDQVRVLQTLNQLASQMNTAQNEQELLDNIAEVIPSLLSVDRCGIAMLDNDGNGAHIVSEYPISGGTGTRVSIQPGNPLYDVIHSNSIRPLVVNIETDTRMDATNREILRRLGTKLFAIIPLTISGNQFGSIGLHITDGQRTFTTEMLEIAQTVASQLAIALQNIRLLTDTRHRAEQLQRIAGFSQSVQSTFDPAAIFDTVLSEGARLLSIDQMAIMLYDTVKQELRTVAERVDSANRIQLRDGELVPISGPIAQVWSTREPMNIPDLRKAGQNISPSVTVRSWMMAPVLARGRVIGMVSAGCNQPSAYADTDVALFMQMINQLAVAIENADAYQQSQRTAKNESLVNDISTQLQRQMDIRSMLDITASELGKVLGARRASIRLATHVPNSENDTAE